MADYLLDCNHLSAAIRKVSDVRDRIHQERKTGNRFITCLPVLCELEAGIQQTAAPADYHRRLAQLLRHVRLWPMDKETARLFGAAFNELRQRGKSLSQVDIMLAALARQHHLVVLSSDTDFDALPDIKRQKWIV